MPICTGLQSLPLLLEKDMGGCLKMTAFETLNWDSQLIDEEFLRFLTSLSLGTH